MTSPHAEPFYYETKRLLLRPMVAADAEFLAHLYADQDVARYIGGDRLTPEAAIRQAIGFAGVWQEKGFGQSVVMDRASGELVGRVGLHPWAQWNEIEIGWVIARTWQHQGIATEAATAWLNWAHEHLPAPYVIAVVHEDNEPSHALAQSLGFIFDREEELQWNTVKVWKMEL